ncbi:cell envelope integrity protein TolA [Vreelandella subglaciescola]|jgi:colicin import membrane protein|uniref:Cell division and transport-associated protein TolA n=1 Tax=Vreelandella subglaciescola TaxID=29571 RepID=A0A1M7ENJ6_9GAMM|nr:cell envelope integrity protein TolA [Halomonas subglaciescola]SHL92999.1 Cell division and transport-associated protein TolA [Halomonas subglaciescola]
MSKRLGRKFRKRPTESYFWPTLLAVLLHLAVFVFSLIKLPANEETPDSSSIVQATLVSTETRTDVAQQINEQQAAANAEEKAPPEPKQETEPEPAPEPEPQEDDTPSELEQAVIDQAEAMAAAEEQRKQAAAEQAKAEKAAEEERQKEAAEQAAAEKAAEEERQQEAAEQAAAEKAAEKERQKEAAEQAAAEKAAEEERQKEAAEQAAAEKRKQEAAEKAKAEKAAAEKRKQEAEAQRKKEAAMQRRLEGEREAAAKAKQAEEAANGFIAIVRRAVEQAWLIPAGASDSMSATLSVRLGPSGEVLAVTVATSSGDSSFDRSAVQAVEQASPFIELRDLPAAQQSELRQFNLRFTPGDVR